MQEVLPAVFLSNVTTAIGFGSLMVSDMRPIADFGLFSAVGMMLSFFFNAIMVPGLLSWLRVGRIAVRPRPTHWTAPLGRAVARRKGWSVALAVAILAMSLLFMRGLRVESNVLKFFPAGSKISQDYRFVAERLTGLYTIELDAVTESRNGSVLLKQIEQFGTELAERPEVAQVIHYKNIATSLNAIHQSAAVTAAGTSENPLRLMMREYRHTDGDRISLRMSILVRAMSGTDFYALMDFARRHAAQRLLPPASYTLTGVVPLLNSAQNSLITTQVRSFAFAAITVLLLIGVFFRSLRVFLAAALPNLLPTAVLFAAMAILDIPLDAATVMIAGVAIGIAVDDTFHFFSCYREARQAGQDSLTAIHSSFAIAGRAILFTSLVATAGFAILLLAQFKPIQYFGLLAGVTMIAASAGGFPGAPGLCGIRESVGSTGAKGVSMESAIVNRLRQVLRIHFDADLGTPYWLERQRELGIKAVETIRSVEDLALLGPMEERALAERPIEDLVPRAFSRTQRIPSRRDRRNAGQAEDRRAQSR